MPEPLEDALTALRPLLLDLDDLVRAVAAGRRRGHEPPDRVELRPVRLKGALHLQTVTHDGRRPVTRNHAAGHDAAAAVAGLLDAPYGNWHVETRRSTVQLRVTKRGAAQVHTTASGAAASGAAAAGPRDDHRDDHRDHLVHDRPKEHLLDPGDPLFDALGAGADKRRQVDAFLRQVQTVLDVGANSADSAGGAGRGVPGPDRPLRVVDLGCGNAYLTFAAHRYLSSVRSGPVHTVGVDVRPDMVSRNASLARGLRLDGLEFVTGTIDGARPFPDADGPGPAVDLVLALHACDTATDDALARAAAWQAPAVLAAPCCHHDLHRQLRARRREGHAAPAPYGPLVGPAILRQRFADVLTDALRAELMRLAGYRVEVVEFIDSRHTPRNALLRLRRADRAGPGAGDATAPGADPAAALIALTDAWRVRPHLLDALGEALDQGLRDRVGPRP